MFLESDINELQIRLEKSLQKIGGKTLLLTGAAGFLGRYFMEVVLGFNENNPKNRIKVIALDSYISSGKSKFDSEAKKFDEVEWIYGDASLAAQLPNRFDYIIHAAGIASPAHYRANPIKTIEVAVNVTKELLEKAKIDNSRFLFFSSSEIYGDPDPSAIPTKETYRGFVNARGPRACYDESKRLGETLCWIYQTYFNVHATVARPFNVYGPGMMPKDFRVLPNFATSIAKNESLKVYGSGKQTRTFCYITDAIDGFTKILVESKTPDVFNIGNPTPEISMIDLAKLCVEISGTKSNFEIIKYPDSYPDDEPNRRCPDINKAKSELNFSPNVDLNDGLERFFTWTKQNYTSEIL